MAAKRLFLGTFLDPEMMEAHYWNLQTEFEDILKGKWVEFENLHFTYQFLGNVEEERVPTIVEALSEDLKEYQSRLTFKGLGVFPNAEKPRTFFMQIFTEKKLAFEIQKSMEQKLEKLGFPPEKRRYKPHASLLRVKNANSAKLKGILAKYKIFKFGVMPKYKVNLIESKLTNEGPIYTVVK